ncbi:hypothetical protein [Vreelandella sp. H-I2]
MTHSPSTAASATGPSRLERESINWRIMTINDLHAAHRLSLRLGWPHRVDDWQQILNVGEGVVLESVDGELVGTGLCFNQGLWLPWGW